MATWILVIIGSGNGLALVQAITWISIDWLSNGPSGINISEIWIKIQNFSLTHWGRVMHICVSKLTSVGSDNGLLPGRRQAIIWTNAGILLIWPTGTNFSGNLIKIHIFSFKKMHLKMSSGKWRPFCLGLNVLKKLHLKMLSTKWWFFCSGLMVLVPWGPFHYHRLPLVLVWISNNIHYKVWDEITYPFPNFNGCAVEVWKWISNFIPHFTCHVIIYPCCGYSSSILVKGAPGNHQLAH